MTGGCPHPSPQRNRCGTGAMGRSGSGVALSLMPGGSPYMYILYTFWLYPIGVAGDRGIIGGR